MKTIEIQWHVEDIKWLYSTRFQGEIDNDQASTILSELRRTHDAEIGINWDTIQLTIQNLIEKGDL